MTALPAQIILFDGLCNFCDASVQFIIDRDPRGRFRFAPLQSRTGQALLEKFKIDRASTDSVVLIDTQRNRAYTKSTAGLQIAKQLSMPWAFAAVLFAVPSALRDLFYDLFARYRYRWFGKKDACRLPTPELRARFIDSAEA